MKIYSLCIKVQKEIGEELRKKLLINDIIKTNLKIQRDENFLYIPVKEKFDTEYKFLEKDFESVSVVAKNYRDDVDIPEEEKNHLPHSMDIIGDICVLKLRDKVIKYKTEIGNAILKKHKNIKVVCLDNGVKDQYRIRKIENVCGEQRTETIHKQYGIKLKLDLCKVYFSPRLATEHHRITNLVKDNEVIIDMFSGIGCFPIMIAKYKRPKKIYAIDINPTAVRYMLENIKLNKIENMIEVIEGDTRDILPTLQKADRVIMDLPFYSNDFFHIALNALKEKAVIHYYEIIDKNTIEERINYLLDEGKKYCRNIQIEKIKKIRTYSPVQLNICWDMIKL